MPCPRQTVCSDQPLRFLSQGFQGKTGPPGPPGVVGPQVCLPPTPAETKHPGSWGLEALPLFSLLLIPGPWPSFACGAPGTRVHDGGWVWSRDPRFPSISWTSSPLLAFWSRGRSPTGTPAGVVTPHQGKETSMEAQERRGAGRKGSWGVPRGKKSEMGGGTETGVCLPFPGSRRGNRAHGGARSPRPARPPWRAGTDRNSWERRHEGQQRAREGALGRTGFGCLRGQLVGDLTGQRSLCPTWGPGSGSSASFPFRVTPDPLGLQGRMVLLV